MAAPKTSPVTFNGVSPPWSLASLDANFAALDAAISNVNNYSNYLVDTGSANAYVVTFPNTQTVTLAAGLLIIFKATNANTGASTINPNALGITSITTISGDPLSSGAIPAGGVVACVYDGTKFRLLGSPPTAGSRNRIVNGDMRIDQRNEGASVTFTAGAALLYVVDRWYGYCTGANVTGQRVAGTSPNQYNYQFTGAASVTKIGFSHRMHATNTQDLSGSTATFSVDLANSLLTTVTWTAWYANTTDTFGTLASPTRTQIATGTFTITSSLVRYATQISIPAAATTGIEIELSVGAQTSGTWTIGRAQLETGGAATPFEVLPFGDVLARCQEHVEKSFDIGTAPVSNLGVNTGEFKFLTAKAGATVNTTAGTNRFRVKKSGATGSLSLYNPAASNSQVRNESFGGDCSSATVASVTTDGFLVRYTGNANGAVGDEAGIHWIYSWEL